MFCTKCGYENSDISLFCSNCGEKLILENTYGKTEFPKMPLSISQYFKMAGSDNAIKRQLLSKRLLLGSSIIQISLLLLGILFNMRLLFVPMFLVILLVPILLGGTCAAGSLLLGKNGIKNKSPGRLFASVPLAFLSICISTAAAINIPVINIIIAFITIAMHITMLILNNSDVKEYKEYLAKIETAE